MKCPKCSMINPDRAKECLRCGTPLPRAARKSVQEKARSRLINIGIITLTIVCLLGVTGGLTSLFFHRHRSQSNAAVLYEYYDENGDYIDDDYADEEIYESGSEAVGEVIVPEEETVDDPIAQYAQDASEDDMVRQKAAEKEEALNEALQNETATAPAVYGAEAVREYYDPESGIFTIPGSEIRLALNLSTNIRASTTQVSPTVLLEGQTPDGLLVSVSCSKVETMPETRSEAIDTAGANMYSRIGGAEDLYYYLFRPQGVSASGNIIDRENSWITQLTITDLLDQREDGDDFSKQAYQTLVRLFDTFESQ